MSDMTQSGPMKVSTSLGGDALLLSRFEGVEEISTPFVFTVDLLSEQGKDISITSMLMKPLVLELDTGSGMRYIHGIIRRFIQQDIDPRGLYRYRAEIVPSLWFLSMITDCRIYQQMTALDIVEDVLKRNGVTAISVKTNKSYTTRDYCVQYRETDLQFVSRLMEEEGIFYFFEHSDSAHTMVIGDDGSAFKPTPGPQTISAASKRAGGVSYEDAVRGIQWNGHAWTGNVTLRDMNYLDSPIAPMETTVSGRTADRNLFDYPGKFLDPSAGQKLADVRIQSIEAGQALLEATSTCRGFTSGSQFTLADHFRDYNGAWTLVRVHHSGAVGYGADSAMGASYMNEFTAIAKEAVYRAAQTTPRPIIAGTQTALVVGASGSEIDTDKYGRVKVQFHWDRLGQKNESSSCWVRVASIWAGKQWGAVHLPRVGQEVVVAFEEGDPDRPIIIGSVYNAEMMPPYDLPANKTQSGIKSRSTTNGGTADFNEFRFEDKKGSEQILLHAQKDLAVEIENSRSESIGNAETKVIDKGDYTETLKQGNYSLDVKQGNHSTAIDTGDCSLAVKLGKYAVDVKSGDVTISLDQGNMTTALEMGNSSLQCKLGNISIKTDLGQISLEAMQGIELKVGANSIKIDQTGVTISGMMVKIDGQVQTQVSGLMAQVSGSAMTQISGGITMIG